MRSFNHTSRIYTTKPASKGWISLTRLRYGYNERQKQSATRGQLGFAPRLPSTTSSPFYLNTRPPQIISTPAKQLLILPDHEETPSPLGGATEAGVLVAILFPFLCPFFPPPPPPAPNNHPILPNTLSLLFTAAVDGCASTIWLCSVATGSGTADEAGAAAGAGGGVDWRSVRTLVIASRASCMVSISGRRLVSEWNGMGEMRRGEADFDAIQQCSHGPRGQRRASPFGLLLRSPSPPVVMFEMTGWYLVEQSEAP